MTVYLQDEQDCRVWDAAASRKIPENSQNFDQDDVYGKVIDGKIVKTEGMRGNSLIEAHGIINGERQTAYGTPEDNFRCIANLWSDYLGEYLQAPLQARHVAIMMALLKIARISTGTATHDSYVDAAGYIGLASDMGR